MNSRCEQFARLAPLLMRLKHSVGKRRRDIIRKCDNDLIRSLSGCCHNVLQGIVARTADQKVNHNLRRLSTKKTSIIARKKILQRDGFLGALITPILSVLEAFLIEHAKKMILVDPRISEQLKDKESLEHEKLLERKHPRSAENKVTSTSNLEIERMLSDSTTSDDQKMKMYSTALNRYLSVDKSPEMPWFAPVLGKLFKMGETAVITSPAAVEKRKQKR